MGKCISKHPSVVTIALSEKDLANTNKIWSKFTDNTETLTKYMAPEHWHANQLCELESNFFVSTSAGIVRNQQSRSESQSKIQRRQQSENHQDTCINVKGLKSSNLSNEGQSEYQNEDNADAEEEKVEGELSTAAKWSNMLNTERIPKRTHKFFNQNNASTNSVMSNDVRVAATRPIISTEGFMLQFEGDDHRHDGEYEYDDVVECTCSIYSCNANLRQNDVQLCLAHLHLLQHWPQAITIECNQERWLKRNASSKNECVLSATEKKAKDAQNDCNKNGSRDGNFERIELKKSASQLLNDIEFEYDQKGSKYKEGQAESKKIAKKYNTNGMETKGTAMSFGFHKKLTSTPKKLKKLIEGSVVGETKSKHDKCNNPKENHERTMKEFIEAQTRNDTNMENFEHKDNNGNPDQTAIKTTTDKIHFEKMGAAAWSSGYNRTTATPPPPTTTTANTTALNQHSNLPGANNRFGFRGIIRPASTGLATRYEKKDNNDNNSSPNENANPEVKPSCLVSNLKRRSKSAHAGRALTSDQSDNVDAAGNRGTAASAAPPKIAQPKTLTFNLSHNSTIEYQRQQFFQQPTSVVSARIGRSAAGATNHQLYHQQHQYHQQHNIVNTGMHTNVIVRPTPRVPPATFSKFTLHTTSLPKPEFPIAISLSTATTPTTPGCVLSPPMAATNTIGSRGQHPLTVVAAAGTNYQNYMDPKAAKHVANSTTRRGFSGSREISADSGIASMDMALDCSMSSSGRSSSPTKRSRSRPRNLQMVMNGRHKFEVRDLDDPLFSESSSMAVEPLSLPKLPNESQTMPLPLSGLVRSNTVLSRDSNGENSAQRKIDNGAVIRTTSEDSESREEKLCLDRSLSEKSTKLNEKNMMSCSKTSSPGSSIMISWCNAAGEALATRDSSIMNSLTDYNESENNKTNDQIDEKKAFSSADREFLLELKDDDLNTISSDMNISPMSSNCEAPSSMADPTFTLDPGVEISLKYERPKSLSDTVAIEKKLAEMALAGSAFLIDDETSPTDSLVSSTASDEAVDKEKKHKINEELQEKDIDEISPELEMASPISPCSPTHPSRSLSLSDCGNLIDDEIADQPALLFNNESQPDGLESVMSRPSREKTDTPTLMESTSLRSLKGQSKARTALQQAIELNLRTPNALRKKLMERAESLDTLSPCDSICSDDLMMDFEMNSSVDSIDRSTSIKSRSGSDLHKIDEAELFADFDANGTDLMKELNTMLRSHQSNREREKSRIIAHLPARATRLLNRSRLQQQCNYSADSPDSARSSGSLHRGTPATSSRASSNGSALHKQQQHSPHMQRSQRDSLSSSDDLMLYDKSFRNAMIQDVLHFKKQLLRLRRLLEEAETINPFDPENGQQLKNYGFDLTKDADLISLISSSIDEPIEDISDLRRQVVYLQSQIDDRDRTIRLQRDLIEKLEAEKATLPRTQQLTDASKECSNMATQTERTRPLSIGAEGLTRSKPEYTSYTTHFPAIYNGLTSSIRNYKQEQQQSQIRSQQQHLPSSFSDCNVSNGNYNGTQTNSSKSLNQTRRHTIISTTLTNYNTQLTQAQVTSIPRRASVAWDNKADENFSTQTNTTTNNTVYKPVRITLIGDTLKQWNDELLALQSAEKTKMLNGNAMAPEKLNNGPISHTQLDDLAKIVKNSATKTTTTATANTVVAIPIDIVHVTAAKCHRLNGTNYTAIHGHSNGNHQGSTATIV